MTSENEEYTPLLSRTEHVTLKPPAPGTSVVPPSTQIDSTDAQTLDKVDPYAKFGGKGKQGMLFFIMLLTNVLGPLSTEAQVPCLQDIANDLNTSSQWVQLSITIYMLFFGASQLVFGTLSDMYGRRNTLLFGLTVYVLTNIGCALSPNVTALNIFRAIQATGSGAGMVIVYAIARDVFQQSDRTRVLGILGGLRPIVIAASPTIGGIIASFLGWRFIFWIIGGLSLCLLVLVFFLLDETRDPNANTMSSFRDIGDTMVLLVKQKVFIGLVLVSGAVYAGVFIMFNDISFVMENRFGFTEFDTGLICGLIVGGLMVGALVSIALVRCLGPFRVVFVGIGLLSICGVMLLLPVFLFSDSYPELNGLTFYWSITPLFFYVLSDGLMLPHLISTALEPFRDIAGSASAIAGFWRFFSAAVIAIIVSWISDDHLLTLHIGVAATAFGAVILYLAILWGADVSEYTRSHDAIMFEHAADDNSGTDLHTDNTPIGVQVVGGPPQAADNSFTRLLDREVAQQMKA